MIRTGLANFSHSPGCDVNHLNTRGPLLSSNEDASFRGENWVRGLKNRGLC